jgi:hypothetical protein
MQTVPTHPGTWKREVPQRIKDRMSSYELQLRNRSALPIMAYAIAFESHGAGDAARHRICFSSQGFTTPMIGAGETKALHPHLSNSKLPNVTPVVDLVLLADGSYFGDDVCKTLPQYQTRLSERRSAYELVLRRLNQDGPEKAGMWLKEELSRDIKPLLNPKPIDPAAYK